MTARSSVAWTAWVAMLASALLYVHAFGSNVPSWDDWDMVPTLTHVQPVTAEWLWSQHNEHRVPLPRLLSFAEEIGVANSDGNLVGKNLQDIDFILTKCMGLITLDIQNAD